MALALKRLSDRIWYAPYETERDRPNLGYIRGDKWSLAVDAGHSDDHVRQFYAALEAAGLPLPSLTVLTHWHWDHTFGLHACHGLSIANIRTNRHLLDFARDLKEKGPADFLALHPSIALEYAGGRPVTVIPADMAFDGSLLLDAGNCPIRLLAVDAPHTDDSTLVSVPREKTLFLGDAAGDDFFTGAMDPKASERLIEAILTAEAGTCLEGHWVPTSAAEAVQEIRDSLARRAGGEEDT